MTNRGSTLTGSFDLMYFAQLVLADSKAELERRGLRSLPGVLDTLQSVLSTGLPNTTLLNELSVVVGIAESQLDEGSTESAILAYAVCRQIEALFKKNVSLEGSSPSSRRQRALEKFMVYEALCDETNERFRAYTEGASIGGGIYLRQILGLARLEIYRLLGDDIGDISTVWDLCTFGPGQNFSSETQEHANLYFKLAGPHSMTESCQELIKQHPSFVGCFPLWTSSLVAEEICYDLVPGDALSTVRKTAEIDRVIGKGPGLNVFIQSGFGNLIARKLRKWGFNLKAQGRNRYLARRGSVQRDIATLDLEGASDTLATEVVRFMLPPTWFEYLDSVRSQKYKLPGSEAWLQYNKFSAMGNGFTFPLETLIFGAICRACASVLGLSKRDCISVYGDDICVPSQMYAIVAEALGACGFIVNESKSYAHGPFRESCGTDYAHGIDVRPVYVRSNPKTEMEVYSLHNRLLCNRIGIQYHDSLAYLHKLVQSPFYGPCYLLAGEAYEKWYAGKSSNTDGYFIAPSSRGSRFLRWNTDTQSSVYHMQKLVWKPAKLKGRFNRHFRYLELLYVGLLNDIDSKMKGRVKAVSASFTAWPEPPYTPNYFYFE